MPVSLVRQRNYRSEYHVLTVVNALKGVDSEKSAVFKELTPSFGTYELRGQGGKKKKKKKKKL